MASKTTQIFAKHIDKIRRDQELSFQEMAYRCDMPKSQVYNICTKGVDLRITSIIKLAKGLNVSIQEIFNFKH